MSSVAFSSGGMKRKRASGIPLDQIRRQVEERKKKLQESLACIEKPLFEKPRDEPLCESLRESAMRHLARSVAFSRMLREQYVGDRWLEFEFKTGSDRRAKLVVPTRTRTDEAPSFEPYSCAMHPAPGCMNTNLCFGTLLCASCNAASTGIVTVLVPGRAVSGGADETYYYFVGHVLHGHGVALTMSCEESVDAYRKPRSVFFRSGDEDLAAMLYYSARSKAWRPLSSLAAGGFGLDDPQRVASGSYLTRRLPPPPQDWESCPPLPRLGIACTLALHLGIKL